MHIYHVTLRLGVIYCHLSVTSHINCIVARYLINVASLMCLKQVIMTLHLLNDIVNDIEYDTKLDNDVIIASLKSESTCKLINRIPGSRLLISSLPGKASITYVESLGKPHDVNKRSRSLTW